MILKLLAKKYVREILEMIEENEELYFSEIMNNLDTHQGSVGRLLSEMVEYDLLSKREDEEGKKLNKTYYSITEHGKLALKIYEYSDKLENIRESKFKMEIKGGENTNIQTEHLDLKIECK